ncbi:hypothetical protein DLJ53_29660 [Acuticoccus sediminis]|uniref:Arylsulfotransferase ASST n=1 Tax=Acuticoccus sediminis TaxID=2184697 RepID=A0A8B2NLM9_9HYPH|nr:arylsulfotransferase family protein [Acuticoccus sediminis]RAH97365.1 hypothetical protein DLJ53_29660 [Acuticoccus sediminis]
MARSGGQNRGPFVFALSGIVLATVYGVLAARLDWFPSPQIALAETTVRDLSAHWKNDLKLEPNRHLVEAYAKGPTAGSERGYRVVAPDAVAEGYVLVAGLNPAQDESFHAVTLYDAAGKQVHRWPVFYERLDPEGNPPQNVMLHGMEVLEDGSLVVTFDVGNAMARIDACGEPMWITSGGFHHSITRDDKGLLWSWRGDDIVAVDENTGEVVRDLPLRTRILNAGGGQQGVFGMHASTENAAGLQFSADPFHANDVEPLTADLAPAFPMFEEGDLLISLRELNLVAVIEPDEGRLRWYRHGPWHRQHDPDFEPDGTITVFDNSTGLGRSRIRRVDPATGDVTDAVPLRDDARFYTWQRGKHQTLPNGNVLVTEAERGRVLEIAPDGSLVWEREVAWDDDRNVIITEARHVPSTFFADGPPSCVPHRQS